MDKGKEVRDPSPTSPVKGVPRTSMMGRTKVNDPPRKGIIRTITGGPANGDSQRARKAQIQAARPTYFGDAYDQMQLGDAPLEAVDTLLYGFAGEVVHPRGMILLPLTLGNFPLRKTCLLKFLVVDIPSAYNVILGRPMLNAFRATISTYHMKIKFMVGGVGEAQADVLQARKCYIEAIKRGKKRILEETSGKEKEYWRKHREKKTPASGERIQCLGQNSKRKPQSQSSRWKNSSLSNSYQGYHQIMLAPEDYKRVSFITSNGTFCYVAMPFGLKNTGTTYQRLVDKIFRPQLGRNMEVYVDDMLVKSNKTHDHVKDLNETFTVLRRYRLKLNLG
ncbi:UNVERIFIED_CONTAM: Retrovirus-related Pol polyprotein from transposon [Sesamum radiatum]|uniref:Retrovirus-related Pol polyprotein from transposon n=1 Tax=Sesamum radiatum TaxID=300843 RepID=A0AAW2JB33_SESRA